MMAEMGCNMNMRNPGMHGNMAGQCGGHSGNRMGMPNPMGRRYPMGMMEPSRMPGSPGMMSSSGMMEPSGMPGSSGMPNPAASAAVYNQASCRSMMGGADASMPCAKTGEMSCGLSAGSEERLSMNMSDMSRQALMKQINEASFAMDDVLLFLDTHPDNANAMRYYQNAVSMRKSAMDAYQRQYGPLLVDDVTGNTWSWVTEKWPWEGEC